jgi:multiple sugar transport system permease protein
MAWMLLAPIMILLIVFLVVPTAATFALAFHQWSIGGVEPNRWVGLANFTRLAKDWRFWNSLRVTLTFTIGMVTIPYMIALPLALFMNIKIPGRQVFRTLFFLPVVTPISAAGLVFIYILNSDFGILNYVLMSLHIVREPVRWLGNMKTVVPATLSLIVWARVGFNAITLLAGLQVITHDLLDAAAIDGAKGWSLFRNITLPMLKPATVVVTTTNLIGSFMMFGEIYVLTMGGPQKATEILGLYIYHTAFQYWQVGYGTTISTVVFAITLVVNAVMAKVGRLDWQ